MKNPGKYKSVSAFAPIANPSKCPWGEKAFKGYFGDEEKGKWAESDATELVKKWSGPPLDVLIDVVCFFPTLHHQRDRLCVPDDHIGHRRQFLQARAAAA